MKLVIATIVYNGMPYIMWHGKIFNKLNLDWHWLIAEGPAANNGSTKWCRPIEAGASADGTLDYLNRLSTHPRITVHQKYIWTGGKDEMFNTLLCDIKEPCIFLEVDADEIWSSDKLTHLIASFESLPQCDHAMFYCQYYVGPDIIITTRNNYGNRQTEWVRAWRWEPGMHLISHEPPIMSRQSRCIPKSFTEELGLTFKHFAWADEQHVKFKEQYYGYRGALEGWRRLQANKIWPVTELRDYLPWVDPGVRADKISR